jgi:hypothetical protein
MLLLMVVQAEQCLPHIKPTWETFTGHSCWASHRLIHTGMTSFCPIGTISNGGQRELDHCAKGKATLKDIIPIIRLYNTVNQSHR